MSMTCVHLPQGFLSDAAEAMPNPSTEGSCCPSSLVNSQLSSAGGWCILLPLHLKTLFYLKDFFCITSRTASGLDSSEPNRADAGCRPLCVGISSQVLLANEAEIAAAAERYLALLLKHFKNFMNFRVSGFGCNPSHALAECHKVLPVHGGK